MKFSNGSSQSRIVEELRRNLAFLAESDRDVLRRSVSVLTTGTDYRIRLPRGNRDLLILACASWYFPEELRTVIQVEMSLYAEDHLGEDIGVKLSLCLRSEPRMILYVLESNVLGYTTEEVFGNIRAGKLRYKVFSKFQRKPKPQVRHRGYRDKGSLGARSHINQEEGKDFTLRDLQIEKERDRDASMDAILISFGFTE